MTFKGIDWISSPHTTNDFVFTPYINNFPNLGNFLPLHSVSYKSLEATVKMLISSCKFLFKSNLRTFETKIKFKTCDESNKNFENRISKIKVEPLTPTKSDEWKNVFHFEFKDKIVKLEKFEIKTEPHE